MIIYKVTNGENDMSYIGQTTKSLEKRKKVHVIMCNHTDLYFHRALKKYGIDNFKWEIIKRCKNKDDLDHWEKYFIIKNKTKIPNGYNMTSGGEGTLDIIITDAKRKKLRMAHLGKKLSKQHRERISISGLGRKASEESKRKQSIAHKGKTLSMEHRRKLSEIHKKRWNPELRKTRSESQKKVWMDEKYREHMINVHKKIDDF